MEHTPDLEMYERLMKFAKNKRDKFGYSNLYVLQLIDHETGEVQEEGYGMNHMTDYGLQQYASKSVSFYFPKNIYIGRGEMNTSEFNRTNAKLLRPLDAPAATVQNVYARNFPLYYDNDSGDITAVEHYITGTVPYYEPGYPCVVTEYGIGEEGPNSENTNDYLWTHSRIYDELGRIKTVQKSIAQDLVISVFLCIVINKSVIQQAWTNQVYPVITNAHRFVSSAMYGYGIEGYRRNDHYTNAGYTNTNVNPTTSIGLTGMDGNAMLATGNNQYARIISLPHTGYRIEKIASNETLEQGYVDGFVQNVDDGFSLLSPVESPTLIPFRYPVSMVFEDWVDVGLSHNFGNADLHALPCTQINALDGCYLFNHHTGYYDNTTPVFNDPTHHYTETPMERRYAETLYYTSTVGTKKILTKVYVHQNIYPNDPIVRFDNNTSDLYTIIGTDAYWDSSDYHAVIRDNESTINHTVDGQQKSYRYYLTTENTTALKPIRKSKEFSLSTKCITLPWFNDPSLLRGYVGITCENPTKQWFVYKDKIYHVNDGTSITISDYTNDIYTKYFTYGDYLLMIANDQKLILYDASATSSNMISKHLNVTNLTSTTKFASQFYKTENEQGLVVLQSVMESKSVWIYLNRYLSLTSDTDHYEIKETTMACCIYGTTYVAYVTKDSEELVIHNTANDTEIRRIPMQQSTSNAVPSNSVMCMIGHGDYVYIVTKVDTEPVLSYYVNYSDTTVSYLTRTEGDASLFSTALQYAYNTQSTTTNATTVKTVWVPRIESSHVDDAFITYDSYDAVRLGACLYYVDMHHPTVCGNVMTSGFIQTQSTENIFYYQRRYAKLRYVHDHTLALISCSGYSHDTLNSVIIGFADFGKFLNVQDKNEDGCTENQLPVLEQGLDFNTKRFTNNHNGYVLYGEYFIDMEQNKAVPIEYALRHIIDGKTKTICALETATTVRDKAFVVYFTNHSSSGTSEFPPGKVQ